MKRSVGRRRTKQSSRIVICGSMSAYPVMEACAHTLRSAGLGAVLPEMDDPDLRISYEQFKSRKRAASRRHISRIMDRRTVAILVVNVDKDGTFDYIGPNTFAEIAIAFAHGKQIFLYQNVPDVYREELEAWEVTPVSQSLESLVVTVLALTVLSWDGSSQLQLFG